MRIRRILRRSGRIKLVGLGGLEVGWRYILTDRFCRPLVNAAVMNYGYGVWLCIMINWELMEFLVLESLHLNKDMKRSSILGGLRFIYSFEVVHILNLINS